ncbi:unnamed protein product [Spirodela intermedia]|uniref:Epidermal patterning factor-like protein n=1 Tax=Spirodela intermedia TaxID=51605 RepID=A0A7I8KXH3_SPIIN|nr:unnamed protein product [Spirodela intermedia]
MSLSPYLFSRRSYIFIPIFCRVVFACSLFCLFDRIFPSLLPRFFLLLLSSSSRRIKWLFSFAQSMLMEDKIRLGSTPPSCHNRCNECNPCMAVQVPTLPGPKGRPLVPMDDESPYKRYPNYKPLGWKCRCGNRLFNP